MRNLNTINNAPLSAMEQAKSDKEKLRQNETSDIGSIKGSKYRPVKNEGLCTFGKHNENFNKHNIS